MTQITPVIPAIGAPFGGGFFAGLHPTDPGFALVVAPKAEGESPAPLAWSIPWDLSAPKSRSLDDGFSNSEAINDDAHPAARFCRGLAIGGFDDWHLPSLGEMDVLRRNLMPGVGGNPEQTTSETFREGGPEAFNRAWYWSSTEYSAGYAWLQSFDNGTQSSTSKFNRGRFRAVRKCPL